MTESKIAALLGSGNKLISSNQLTKYTVNEKGKSNFFIAITSYFLAFCDKKAAKFETVIYYDQLTSYNSSEKKIEIKFLEKGKETAATLESKEISKIDKTIVKVLQKVFTDSELTKLTIEPSNETSEPDDKCTVQTSRYLIKKHSDDKKKLDSGLLKTLQSQFATLKPDEPDNSEPILYAVLNNTEFIESVELPQFPTQLAKDQPTLPFLHLLVSGLNDELFDDFLNYLSQDMNQGKLTGLTIKECNLNEDNYQKLVNFATKKLVSLSIQNSSIPSQFYQFFDNDEPEKLMMLNLDSCSSLNTSELIQNTSFLTSLSIANCNVDIGDFIIELNSKNFERLAMLNLSGNSSGNITTNKIILPPSLQVIDVSNVKWTKESLYAFLTLLFEDNFIHGIKLNLSYALLNESEWQDIFDYLTQCDASQLTELDWSGNPVNPSFNAFLSRCNNLKILKVNSCLDNSMDLAQFGETVANLQSLVELYAAGNNAHSAGPNISNFVEQLERSQSLKLVDLHSQKIEYQGLESVDKLIEANNSIDIINIDDCSAKDIKELLSFLNLVAKAKRSIRVSYPDLEIESLKDSSSNDIKLLRNQLTALGNGEAVYKEEEPKPEEKEEPANDKDKKKDKKSKDKDKKAKDKKSKDKKSKGNEDSEKVPEPSFFIFRIEDKESFPTYVNPSLENQLTETVQPKLSRRFDQSQDHSDHNRDESHSHTKQNDLFEEEEENLPPKKKSSKKDRKSSKEINKQRNTEEEEEEELPQKKKSSKKDRKSSKTSKKHRETEEEEEEDYPPKRKSSKADKKNNKKHRETEEEEEEDYPPKRKSSKADRKSSKAHKKHRETEEEEEEDYPPKRKSSKTDRKSSKAHKKHREAEEEEEEDYPPKRKSSKVDKKNNKKHRETEEEEEEDYPPKRKSSKADRKSSKAHKKHRETEEEEEEDYPPKRKSSKADRKSSKSNRRHRRDAEEEEEEELPPKRKSSKPDRKSSKSNKRHRDAEEEEEEDYPPKRKSSKADRKSSKRNRRDVDDEEEEELPPRRKSSKADRKSSKSNRRHRDVDEEEEEDYPPKRKSSKADRKSSKRNRRDFDEEEEEEPRRKSSKKDRKSSKRNRRDMDEEEEESQPRRKSSRSNRKNSRMDREDDSSSSGLSKLTSKRETKKKPVMDSESLSESESQSSQQDAKNSPNKKAKVSSFADSAPKPKPDQYEQPNWTLPEQLSQKYDPQPVFHKLQKQYDLKVLRDAI